MALLEVKNLTFSYNGKEDKALDDISFSIDEGEFVVICGETGCGKTTLLKLLKKEIAPHGIKEGLIIYDGKNIKKLTQEESVSQIGFVFQNPENQIVTDKVWHELAFGLENLGIPTNEIRIRVGEMANYFGIDSWFRSNTANLSGGQKQLLNLASILLMKPKLLLLDEPTSHLDPIAASEFINTLVKINNELGLTIILVEHRLEEVFSIANKIIVLEKGNLIANDEPRKVAKKLSDLNSSIIDGLPSSVRIFNGLKEINNIPLNVKEGKILLENNYNNDIFEINITPYIKDNDHVIDVKNVWFRYEKQSKDILRGLNLSISKGEVLSIVGGNGSGKTTLLNIITNNLKPYQGKILINGKKIKEYKKNSLYINNLTMLPQNPQDLFLKSNVREDLEEALNITKLPTIEKDRLFDNIITMLKIENLLDSHPYDLSGGEQQKVALAKILLLQPKILLLDEPTKGLDAHSKLNLIEIIRTLKANHITVIIVTHDIEFASLVSDECAMLFDGEIISISDPHNFFSNNSFYTTAASRISRKIYKNTIIVDEVINLALTNGRKNEENN